MKKKRAIISIAALLVVAALLVGYIAYSNATSYVAEIDGEKITEEEYRFFLYNEKREMENREGAAGKTQEEIEALWNSKIDGVDATEVLKQNALENVKKYKIQLFKAEEQGLFLNDNDYNNIENSIESLLGQISDFEGSRREAERSFREEFGVTVDQYREIAENLNLGFKFARREQEENMSATQEELREHYDENSENFTTATANILVFYKRDVHGGWDMFPEEKIEEARENAEEAFEKIKEGERLSRVAAEFADDPNADLERDTEIKMDAHIEPEIKDWALKGEEGDLGLVDTDLGFNIIEILELTSFEDVRDRVRNVVVGEKYEDLLEEWTKDPKYNLELNERALDRIKIR
ncbi:SurA N-terminal domain-containing protein [Herbivorax sp. ANBcel31]|uniref:peptidylprolyl isomerase n=1 Tax=Herbivorax sp. ANBcel31 TaxID=3069754 RepID=UPI0027B3B7C3|nr:peptidylprolyl isomerase [Herbivorax sp. ANBcel31]MDQ2086523.1 SurA N-terminal domain-containing protein [Herbivorax sp. ANBcel31]